MMTFTRQAIAFIAVLGLASVARAQIDSWALIRPDGAVVLDLAEHDLRSVRPVGNGLAVVEHQNLESSSRPGELSLIRTDQPLGPQLKRRYVLLRAFPDGTLLGRRQGGSLELLGPESELISASSLGSGMSVERYLGEGMVLIRTEAKRERDAVRPYRIKGGAVTEVKIPKNINKLVEFSDGLCAVRQDFIDRFGAIDRQGKLVIPTDYDEPFLFEDGVARVVRDGEVFWINKDRVRVPAPAGFLKVVESQASRNAGLSEKYVVDEIGRPLTGKVRDARASYAMQRIAVETDEGAGLLDLEGGEVLAPSSRWLHFEPGENGLIAAASEDGWGYVDADGKVVIEPKYARATPFVSGIAAVCTRVSDPNLAGMPYSHRWYAENADQLRELLTMISFSGGDLDAGLASVARPGQKYGGVFLGDLKGGKPHGVGWFFVPGREKQYGDWENGKLKMLRVSFYPNGTRHYDGSFDGALDGALTGKGHSRHPNGKLDFIGEFVGGEPWDGHRVLPGGPNLYMQVDKGEDTGRTDREGNWLDRLADEDRGSGSSGLVRCDVCYGAGGGQGRGHWVDEYQLDPIVPGDKKYMSSYTHYRRKTGHRVRVEGLWHDCGKCKGQGWYER